MSNSLSTDLLANVITAGKAFTVASNLEDKSARTLGAATEANVVGLATAVWAARQGGISGAAIAAEAKGKVSCLSGGNVGNWELAGRFLSLPGDLSDIESGIRIGKHLKPGMRGTDFPVAYGADGSVVPVKGGMVETVSFMTLVANAIKATDMEAVKVTFAAHNGKVDLVTALLTTVEGETATKAKAVKAPATKESIVTALVKRLATVSETATVGDEAKIRTDLASIETMVKAIRAGLTPESSDDKSQA